MPIQLPCTPSMPIQLPCTPSMTFNYHVPPICHSITMYPLYAYSITLYPLYDTQLPCTPSMPIQLPWTPSMPFNKHVPPSNIVPRALRARSPRQMALVQAGKICKNLADALVLGMRFSYFHRVNMETSQRSCSERRRCIRLCFSRYLKTSARYVS